MEYVVINRDFLVMERGEGAKAGVISHKLFISVMEREEKTKTGVHSYKL
jgi:hypothetical protein